MLRSFALPTASALLIACGPTVEHAADVTAVASETLAGATATPPSAQTLAAADALYTWVDGLSLRAAPASDATRVGRAGPSDALTPTGQVGGEVTAVVLRGGLYETPWLEVALADGTTGYAFAGALRRPSDPPGPAAAREDVIDVEHFGRFDLAEWREASREPLDQPEADGTVVRYRKAARELEVVESDMGEMHYGRTHRLLGDDGTVFREHRFAWSAGGLANELSEEVIVREGTRPRRYVREQTAATHYYSLAERPTRVVGPWREAPLESPGASMPDAPTPAVLAAISDGVYRSLDDARAGIIVVGGRLGHGYDGQFDDLAPYRLTDACPPEAGDFPPVDAAPGELLVVEDDDGPMCYLLLRTTPDYIEMAYLGGAGGAPLRYERVPEEGL